MKELPVGIQSFRELRELDLLYIDKTEQVKKLVQKGKYYFLARPRRFGKSLLVSKLKYLFEGNKELFKGLWIEDKWNWEETYPVLHFRFSLLDYQAVSYTHLTLPTIYSV